MADSIQRITSVFESARDMTLEAAAAASSRLDESSYFQHSKNITTEGLRNLLNSRSSKDVKEGMKRIIALIASDNNDTDLKSFFADVVKNITSEDVKVKRMVCVYLLRFAEKDPNLALLSINSIQRTLTDPDPETRSLSLKALSDIKIPSLYPVVLHSLKKPITDVSPLVRASVATALLKLYREQGNELRDEVLTLLKDLLADANPQVVSSAVILLKEAFPTSLELLHGHFRRYCDILPQMNDWSQSYLIELLIKYCKTFLPRPMVIDVCNNSQSLQLPDNYNEIPFPVYDVEFHPDLKLFLCSINALVYSQNPMVVVSISKALFQLTPPQTFKDSKIAHALVRLITATKNQEIKCVILQSILLYSSMDPTLFLPFIKKFYLLPSDSLPLAVNKLKTISVLVNETNCKPIVSELKYCIKTSTNPKIILESVNTLGVCAQLSDGWSFHIMKWLLSHVESPTSQSSAVMDSYVNVIRYLVQRDPTRHLPTIVNLSKILDTNKDLVGSARAGIIWLVGEFAAVEFKVCPDILRKLIRNFSRESVEVRLQILVLAAKLLSYDIDNFKTEHPEEDYDFNNSRISQMFEAVSYLAKFDDDCDIRDRARTLSSIFANCRYEIATLLLQAPKPSPMVSLHPFITTLNGNKAYDISPLGLDSSVENYHQFTFWDEQDVHLSEKDIREPCPVKDYSRTKTSFSSSSYFDRTSSPGEKTRTSSSPYGRSSQSTSNAFTSSQGTRYQLQSLDEFFSDVPNKPKPRRRIIVEEESTGEDDDDDDDDDDGDDDESESEDGSLENVSSDEDEDEEGKASRKEENE